jgi:hypothetical protein
MKDEIEKQVAEML